MVKIRFILLLMVVIFISCKKDTPITCPPKEYRVLNTFVKGFNFKEHSYWVFKNTSTLVKDTMRIYFNPGIRISQINGTSKECYDAGTEEGFETSGSHTFFSPNVGLIDYYGQYNGLSAYSSQYHTGFKAVIESSGDSVVSNNCWSKCESIYTTISINGNIYNNVYQMYYYPDLYGFKRIWWCPSIGFVKFEHFNTTTSLSEFWELNSYNVQLF